MAASAAAAPQRRRRHHHHQSYSSSSSADPLSSSELESSSEEEEEEEECLLFSLLPEPLLELALSRLPVPSAICASAASRALRRRLLRLSKSPPAPFLPTSPCWFFFLGLNNLLPSKSQSFAFDPVSVAWFRVPLPSPPPLHNKSSLSSCASSSDSFLFSLQGPLQNRISLLSLSPKFSWHTLPSLMSVPRSSPLAVASFRRFVLVAAGGDPDSDADPRSVEIFDRRLRSWRPADPLPEPLLHAASSSSSSSSVVCNGRMYVADCYSGTVAWIDPEEGKWGMALVERPDSFKWWSLVALDCAGDGRQRLVAVVLCAGDSGGMKVMEIDESTMQIRGELGRMPPDLLRSLVSPAGDDDDAMDLEKHVPLRCSGGGSGIIYIYSPSPFADYPLILCKLSPETPLPGGCTWFAPPPLPSPVHRFDRVLCFSAAMPLTAFLSPCPKQRTEDPS